jgi:hypothetical protein
MYFVSVKFYRDSLILGGVTIFLTIGVANAMHLKYDPPPTLSTVAVLILRCPGSRIFLFSMGDEEAAKITWKVLAIVIDRLSFLAMLIVEFIMLVTLIPPDS